MRTFLKLFLTLVVLVGGLAAYLIFQPASSVLKTAGRPVPQPLTRNAAGLVIGEGENAWVRQFDNEGRLASRFRAERWEPETNGLVRVTRPEAELILKGGKDRDGREKPRPLVRIRGDDGEVVVRSLPDASSAENPMASESGAGARGASPGPAQPPSSGRLNGVIIEVFETESDATPRVTLRTNNIVFDNDTFRISTESYQAPNGVTVAPDEVPISVTGPDFDFFGRGLTVRWNDLDERLELLRIAHGERLVIKNVAAFSGAGGLPLGLPKRDEATASDARAARVFSTGAMLASADHAAAVSLAVDDRRGKEAAGQETTPRRAGTKPARKRKDGEREGDEQPPYRATFNEGVRVVQGETQLATARLMNVDFALGQRKNDRTAPQSATQAAPAATRPTVAPEPAPAQSTTAPVADTQSAAARVSNGPTAGPAASTLPVTVYWTGELAVTPMPTPTPSTPGAGSTPVAGPSTAPVPLPAPPAATPAGELPLPAGEARVELVGAPAVLTRDALEIRTARFVYRTDGRLSLAAAEDFPSVLITQKPRSGDGPATTVSTEGLTYVRNDGVATLRGDSRVIAPIEAAGDGTSTATPGMLDASWRDAATFKLVGQREDEMWVEHAAFSGGVDVKAPQVVMQSEHLELSFDPPSGKSTPRLTPTTQPIIPAASNSVGRFSDSPALSDHSSSPSRSDSPNLRRIVATDSVYCELTDAAEGKRVLVCQRLALDTARSGERGLYPRTVDASGAVHATGGGQELNAGHVVLQLKPAKDRAAEAAPSGSDSGELALDNKGQRIIAGAGTLGLAGTSRPVADASPEFEIESMVATDAVRVASADGGVASGKRLWVTFADDGSPRVELTGDPARVDHAADGGSLTGPRIEIDPKTGIAHIVGPGTLRAVQRDEPSGIVEVVADAAAAGVPSAARPSRPIEVTWADGAEVRGADDRIEITGAVSVWITDTDGSVRTATAGRVRVELAKKTGEEGEPGPDAMRDVKPPRAAGGLAGSMDMDLFKNREVSRVLLYDNAVVNSRLSADDGTMLQQFHLKSQTIAYDVRSRHLAVPGPGQMLVEIHDPKNANGEAKMTKSGGAESPALGGGSGVTAFEWQESMEYNEANGRAAMDGSVVLGHQPDPKGGKAEAPVRLDADALIATFEPDRGDSGQLQSPDTGKNNRATNLRLSSMSATGGIVISREGAELTAREISYNPANEWVIARGTARNPATFTAPGATGTMRAGELWMNTRTWAVKVKDVNTRVGDIGR